MKVGDIEVGGLYEDVLILPRGNKKLVFRARGISDFTEFDKLCPIPQPPTMLQRKDGKMERVPNVKDPIYLAKIGDWSKLRASWIVLKSLEPSNIQWDTVQMDKPETWNNYYDELLKNFSDGEAYRIGQLVNQVNCLDELKLKDARESFFQEQVQQEEQQNSQTDDQPNTSLGVPASDPTDRIRDMKKQLPSKT